MNGEEPASQDLTTRIYRSPDLFGLLFQSVGIALSWPFNLLQSLVHPMVNWADDNSNRAAGVRDPEWEIRRFPTIVFQGSHNGHITVGREVKDSGIFPWSNSKQYAQVNFLITDAESDPDKVCEASYVIPWDDLDEDRSSGGKKIRLQPNSVNYIKIEFHQNEIKLIREGCKA